MKRTLNIPDDLYAKIQEMAKRKGITVSALINLACSEYIEQQEQKK